MKKFQRIILAFMLGIMPIQSVLADSKATELTLEEIKLFTNGADAYDKNTWLIYAPHMNKESLEAVKYLIDKGADVNAKGSQGRTALMEASRFGRLEVVKYLISKGADVNAKDNNGFTALIIASLERHLEVVKYLLDKDADINAKNNYGGTALMFASLNGHLEIVKYLISKSANVNDKDNNGVTALIGAAGSGHLDIVKTLAEGKSGLLSMFSKGADINAKATIENNGKKAEGVTALIIASMQGHLEVVKYLISKGANVNDKFKLGGKMNMDGGTALIIALMGEHLEIAKYLISKGADVNAKFKTDDEYGKKMDGVTALIWASMNENLEIVKQLINKGADVNAVMSMSAYNFITLNYTALDMATDGKYHKIIEVLKKAGGKFAKEIK